MSRFNSFIRLGDDFLSLFFPRLCQACGQPLVRNENTICMVCLSDLPFTGFHDIRENNLEKELWGRCYVERAAALCYYRKGSRIQKMIHRMKYNGKRQVAVFLGEFYGNIIRDTAFIEDIDLIVPVPLHRKKERKRGYNQSLLIARGMSVATGIEIEQRLIKRIVATSSQTSRSRADRWENVRGIFSLKNHDLASGKHILLVDDVITSGSTIEACVNEIKKAPGARVSVIALGTAVL